KDCPDLPPRERDEERARPREAVAGVRIVHPHLTREDDCGGREAARGDEPSPPQVHRTRSAHRRALTPDVREARAIAREGAMHAIAAPRRGAAGRPATRAAR